MDTNEYTKIAGVYRERAQAEQAVAALKQAGFGNDLIQVNQYDPNPGEEADDGIVREANRRVVVSVEAGDRQQEVVGILTQFGSNNADLPPGTILFHGNIVRDNEQTSDIAEKIANGTSVDSFFDEAKVAGHPDEIIVMDNPNFPHG